MTMVTLDNAIVMTPERQREISDFINKYNEFNAQLTRLQEGTAKAAERVKELTLLKAQADKEVEIAQEDLRQAKLRTAAANAKASAADAKFQQDNARFLAADAKFQEDNARFLAADAKFQQDNARFLAADAKYQQDNAKYLAADSANQSSVTRVRDLGKRLADALKEQGTVTSTIAVLCKVVFAHFLAANPERPAAVAQTRAFITGFFDPICKAYKEQKWDPIAAKNCFHLTKNHVNVFVLAILNSTNLPGNTSVTADLTYFQDEMDFDALLAIITKTAQLKSVKVALKPTDAQLNELVNGVLAAKKPATVVEFTDAATQARFTAEFVKPVSLPIASPGTVRPHPDSTSTSPTGKSLPPPPKKASAALV